MLFEELTNPASKDIKGYQKIVQCCARAKADGYQYVWIDTCSIIQTHHRRQRPRKGVAYAAENGGRTYIAFQYAYQTRKSYLRATSISMTHGDPQTGLLRESTIAALTMTV